MADNIYGLTTEEATRLYNQLKSGLPANQQYLSGGQSDYVVPGSGVTGVFAQAKLMDKYKTGSWADIAENPQVQAEMAQLAQGVRTPYKFLAPGYSTTTGGVTSVQGATGSPNQISVYGPEQGTYIGFSDLEKALGLGASGATTPGLYQNPNGNQAAINALGVNQSYSAAPSANPYLGVQPTMTPTVITSAPAQTQYANSSQTIQSGLQNLATSQPSATGGTLYDYFQSQGKPLPSVSERAPLYDQLVRQGNMVLSPYTGTAQQNQQLLEALQKQSGTTSIPQGPQPLNLTSANEAMASIVKNLNTIITQSGQQLTPEQQAQLNAINATETAKNQALAAGQIAQQNGNIQGVNDAAKTVSSYEAKIQQQLTDFQKTIQPLRDAYLQTLLPSQKEQDINKRLTDLRASAQLTNVQLGNQPIAMPFITGQQAQMAKLFSAQEANLIAELGIEKDAEAAAQKVAQGKIEFANQDYELQTKIADKLKASEDNLVQQVRQQSSDKQAFYANVAKMFAETNLSNNPDAAKQLQQLALDSGADPSLALAIAKNSYNQTVFENSIKQQTHDNKNTTMTLTEAKSAMYGALNNAVLDNGKVSSTTWIKAKSDWIANGYNADDFDTQFGTFNPGIE